MNYKLFTVAALMAICFTFQSFAQEISEYKRYPYKSGVIVYEITGNTYKGTATLYWDNYGMKEALYTDKSWKKGFITLHSVNTVEIVDGDYNFEIDLDDEEGTKSKNNYAEKYGKLQNADEIYQKTVELMKELGFSSSESSEETNGFGGVEIPTGIPGVTSTKSSGGSSLKICGKPCQVFKMENKDLSTKLTYYMWEGILMASDEVLPKIPLVGQPQFTKKCTSIKVDVTVSPDKFTIPKGVEIEEKS